MATKRAYEEDVYLFFAVGPGIDVDRAAVDQEYLFELIRKKSRIADLQFGGVKTVATYRFALYVLVMDHFDASHLILASWQTK